MWNQKNGTDELICEADVKNKLMDTKGGGGGMNREIGIDIYTTMYKIDN